jgi:hypothetical protein
MWISLHVGPHKTGTTSVQTFLLQRFGSGVPREIWYPVPSARGPGHSLLALDHLRGGTLLKRLASDAAQAGVQHLILSSEDFSFFDADAFERLSFLANYDVRLIVTLNSLKSRVPSLWQEMVKHGHSRPISGSVDQILNNPGTRPDFVTTFASALKPKDVSIILVSRSAEPDMLLSDLCSTLRLEQSPHDFGYSNKSMGYFETELLRHVNSLMAMSGVQADSATILRELIISAIQSPRWKSVSPKSNIRTPDEYRKEIDARTKETWEEICELEKTWPIRIFGDKRTFLDEI